MLVSVHQKGQAAALIGQALFVKMLVLLALKS